MSRERTRLISTDRIASSVYVEGGVGQPALGQAAAAASLPVVLASDGATEAHLGEVGGNTDSIAPTLAVDTAAYLANDVVGGKLTITNAMRISGGTGILTGVTLVDLANQKAAFDIFLFNADPSAGTYTDNGAISWNDTDLGKCISRIEVLASDYKSVGSKAVASLRNLGEVVKAVGSRHLYALMVTTSAPDYVATTDLIVRFKFVRD